MTDTKIDMTTEGTKVEIEETATEETTMAEEEKEARLNMSPSRETIPKEAKIEVAEHQSRKVARSSLPSQTFWAATQAQPSRSMTLEWERRS